MRFALTPLGTPALGGHDAVLHLRSMTKDHALAGVRVAFGVAAPDVAESLERVRVPWAASTRGAGGRPGGADGVRGRARRANHSGPTLRGSSNRSALTTRGITVRPSATHFLHPLPTRRAQRVIACSPSRCSSCATVRRSAFRSGFV